MSYFFHINSIMFRHTGSFSDLIDSYPCFLNPISTT